MERIMKYINRVYRASLLDRSEAFAEENLAGQQLSYILQICRSPGLTQDELSARLFVNKSTVTRQVSQMIQNGYIIRHCDPEDRRAKLLYPSEKAREIYPRIMEYLENWNESLTGMLKPEEQDQLLYFLKHLASAASKTVCKNSKEKDAKASKEQEAPYV